MEGTIGEIRLFASAFAPRNWSYCNGALVSISQNTALYSILGTTYGGDGKSNFALPNLNGRTAIGAGAGPGLTSRDLGETGGVNATTLLVSNLAMHTHTVTAAVEAPAFSESGNSATGNGNVLASLTGAYSAVDDSAMRTVQTNIMSDIQGNSQPLSVNQPSLGMNYIVCMYGVYPQRPY